MSIPTTLHTSDNTPASDMTPPLPPLHPIIQTIPSDHYSYSITVGVVSVGEIYAKILEFKGDTVLLSKIYSNIIELHQSKLGKENLIVVTLQSLTNTLDELETLSKTTSNHIWLVSLYNTVIQLTAYRMLKHIKVDQSELAPVIEKIKEHWAEANRLLDLA